MRVLRGGSALVVRVCNLLASANQGDFMRCASFGRELHVAPPYELTQEDNYAVRDETMKRAVVRVVARLHLL